jgi:hypothetical protein
MYHAEQAILTSLSQQNHRKIKSHGSHARPRASASWRCAGFPATSQFFKLEQEKGLVDVLMGTTTVDNVLRFHKDLKLMVIRQAVKA